MARDQRRLAAIVSADVVGYSRLMGRDESDTLAALKAHRRELIDPKIAEYGGRIVKTTGDGLLLEFPSVVEAVRCAVDVQRGMAERNTGIPAERRIEFRVGINVGDIIVDDDDIYGDGVNVAARLQVLADRGEICVSKVVRDHVLGKLSYTFEDLGEQWVKNIARPVEAYRVQLDDATLQASSRALRYWQRLGVKLGRLKRLRGPIVAFAALGAVLSGLVGYWNVYRVIHDSAPPATSSTSPSQPPPMSIAVLPFRVPKGSAIDEAAAQTLTHDVIAALARSMRYALVASYGSVASYQGKPVDSRTAGHDLNVRYLAEGEIRQDGEKVVVVTPMVDAVSATQVWSDRVDTTTDQLNTAAVAEALAHRLKNALFESELRRADALGGAKADAGSLWLRALAEDGTLKGVLNARKLLDESLQLNPRYVSALVHQCWVSRMLLELDPNADRDRLVGEMDDFSRRAVSADSRDPRAWDERSLALALQYRRNEALEALDESLRIDPNRARSYIWRGVIMTLMGRPQDVFAELDKVVAIDIREADDAETLGLGCSANLASGRYDNAIRLCERAASLTDDWSMYFALTAAYAQKGEMTKAAAAKAQLLRLQPGYTIERFRKLRESDAPAYWEQTEAYIFPGLRKAGLPEH